METEVEKVTTVDIGGSRRLYITGAKIAEPGQSPGCYGCMGVQKFHDESPKRFERIYLHTAAVPTSALPGRVVSGVKRRDDARSAKRATTTAEVAEMENAERKRKDQALDSPPGLESAAHRSSESKRRRVAARIE